MSGAKTSGVYIEHLCNWNSKIISGLLDHWFILSYNEIWDPPKPVLGDLASVARFNIGQELSQFNRVNWFFLYLLVYSLFPEDLNIQNLFSAKFILLIKTESPFYIIS